MKILLGIIVALVIGLAGVSWHDIHQTKAAATAEAATADATAANAQLQVTLQTERNNTAAANAVAEQYEQDKANAEKTAQTISSDLSAHRIRLRTIWRCPTSAAVPSVAASTSQPHGIPESRSDSAATIVRAADDSDAQVKALQAILTAERKQQ